MHVACKGTYMAILIVQFTQFYLPLNLLGLVRHRHWFFIPSPYMKNPSQQLIKLLRKNYDHFIITELVERYT